MTIFKKLDMKEWVTITYFCWLIVISIVFREHRPGWYWFVLIHTGLIIAIMWVAQLPRFDRASWRFVRDLYLYLFALLGYKESAYFVQVIYQRWFDDVLVRIDYAMFGFHPTVWMAEHGHIVLNEFANFAYFSYFVYVPVLVFYLWGTKSGREVEGFLGGLVMSYNFSYIFFALLPASSPRFALPEFGLVSVELVRLDGYLFTGIIDMFMDKGAMRGGAFPSVHCCASTVFLLNTYKYCSKKTALIATFFVLSMYWSTVYGRYHYVIDVLAGIAMGVVFSIAGHYLQSKIETWRQSR